MNKHQHFILSNFNPFIHWEFLRQQGQGGSNRAKAFLRGWNEQIITGQSSPFVQFKKMKQIKTKIKILE